MDNFEKVVGYLIATIQCEIIRKKRKKKKKRKINAKLMKINKYFITISRILKCKKPSTDKFIMKESIPATVNFISV